MLKVFGEILIVGLLLRLIFLIYAPQGFLLSVAHGGNEDWNRVREECSLFGNPDVVNASAAIKQPPVFLLFWKLLNQLDCNNAVFLGFEFLAFISFMTLDCSLGYPEVAEKNGVWVPVATFVYAFNPYSILSFAINSVGILSTLITCWIFIALRIDYLMLASVLCAVAGYIHIFPGYLFLAVLCQAHRKPIRMIGCTLYFIGTLIALFALSFFIAGKNWGFISHSYLSNVFALDMTPNMGIFWYMYVEMFDHFNTFFVWTMQLIIFATCTGLALRFYEDSFFLALALTMSTGVLRPYNSITDFGCSLALAAQWFHLGKYYKRCYMAIGGLFVSLILAPLFYFTWLSTATSNANFYFAAALIHGLSRVHIVSKLLGAYLRHGFTEKFGTDPRLSNGARLAPKMKL